MLKDLSFAKGNFLVNCVSDFSTLLLYFIRPRPYLNDSAVMSHFHYVHGVSLSPTGVCEADVSCQTLGYNLKNTKGC